MSIENLLLNHILFQLMMLPLHQIILYGLENYFQNVIKIITINDQIRNEKIRHDINGEAAKISTLSSDKIHKYEYLTREDILPSNQQQIIEQARFTYSPLGKAFEKQIKTIQDQGQVKTIKKYAYDAEDTQFISKQKEIFNELIDERHEKITHLDKKKLIVMIYYIDTRVVLLM